MNESGGTVDPRLTAGDRALIRSIMVERRTLELVAELHRDEYDVIKAHLEQAEHVEFTTLADIDLSDA